MNILFTCAGRRNYLIEYFQDALKGEGMVFAADMQQSAPALVAADKAFVVPSIYSEDYIDSISKICENNNVKAIISLNDLELPILSEYKRKFESLGVKMLISSERVINITFDKFETALFAESVGINTPNTFKNLESAEEALNYDLVDFPLVVKPRWGSASIGIEFVNSIEELKLTYELQQIKLKKSMLAMASKKDMDQAIIIQQFINGQEYGIDIINDLKGNYKSTVVKKKLAMRAGETDKAITEKNDQLAIIGERLSKELKHIGNLDCDFFLYKDQYYLLEMNSRFGGGYPFSHEAGVNLPLAIISWLNEKDIDDAILIPEYNLAFSKCDKLIKIQI